VRGAGRYGDTLAAEDFILADVHVCNEESGVSGADHGPLGRQ